MPKKVPKYLKDQIQNYVEENNAQRKMSREGNYEWDSMSPAEKAVAESRGNVGELKGEYQTGQDLRDLERQHYHETDIRYMDNYISAWEQYCILDEGTSHQVIEDIRWIVENKPDTLRKILDRGYSYAQIDYIYPNSADQSANVYTRQNLIQDFWHDVRNGEYD